MKKIKVLIVDDSIVFREIIARRLSSDISIEVVATAKDPYDARDKIIEFSPDVMTCDVEMPKMNGIEFIRRLLPQYPLPVIVVSTVSEAVFDAMNAGAVDFVTKPDMKLTKGIDTFINELITKIKIASVAKVSIWKSADSVRKVMEDNRNGTSDRIIAIGASTGGTEAIFNVLKALPSNTPGILIVQHIPPMFSKMFADRLNNTTSLKVKEAQTGDCISEGNVLIAPGDKHMILKKLGDKLRVECFEGEKVNGHCPSVDVMFNSVAECCGSNAIGIILTGMGHDGSKGLLSMRKRGARTIGQDELSCVVYGMPRAAFNIGAVERQAALKDIPKIIHSCLYKGDIS